MGNSSTPVVYVNWGMWVDMTTPQETIRDVWAPNIAMLRQLLGRKATIVCGLTATCGPHKAPTFLPTQGNQVIRPYNALVAEWCRSQGLAVFDMWAVIRDVEDLDGTHFTPWANVHIAQLLLQFISQLP
jgi:hypothetical protein